MLTYRQVLNYRTVGCLVGDLQSPCKRILDPAVWIVNCLGQLARHLAQKFASIPYSNPSY